MCEPKWIGTSVLYVLYIYRCQGAFIPRNINKPTITLNGVNIPLKSRLKILCNPRIPKGITIAKIPFDRNANDKDTQNPTESKYFLLSLIKYSKHQLELIHSN